MNGNSRNRPTVLAAASSFSFQQSVCHSLKLMRAVVYERASDIVPLHAVAGLTAPRFQEKSNGCYATNGSCYAGFPH